MRPFDEEGFRVALQKKIDTKTKPLGALGKLEKLAFQIGMVQKSLTPELRSPKLFIFVADHGIAREGVSAYPAEVTHQMALNFLSGGAAINVFCKQHNIALNIVDAGVNADLTYVNGFIDKKVAFGTQNFLHTNAMTIEQCQQAFVFGQSLIDSDKAPSIFCFGEMGIGNTSSASIIMSLLCDEPIENCVGRGTGLSNQQHKHKLAVLSKAIKKHQINRKDPMEVLTTFGGFEIAMMSSAMLAAAKGGRLIVVDGFIATAAFLIAHGLKPEIIDHAIFSHVSDEHGHQKMLDFLGADPLLKLDLRLGEGTGCALAYPLIESAVIFLNDMASFESAGVSKESND
ncbi:MAG: nicotinate-nucleotide--dimethylbenzimidazole phosphoribosyltransferase [Bacteroidota bacterium]